MSSTTLKRLKEHNACVDRYKHLLDYLGKTKADNEELPLAIILKSNGIEDAIWALRTLKDCDKEIRLFAADCAGHVLKHFEKKHPNDKRPREAIKAARKFAKGEISRSDLRNAAAYAYAAAAAYAAYAAYAAAYAAADDAAYAAYAAADDAADDAAYAAARTKEKEYQKRIFKKYFCKKRQRGSGQK